MSQRIFSDELIVAAGKRTKEQEFWLNQLAGPLVKSSFPVDYRKKEPVEINKAHVNFQFSKKIYSELMNLSKGSDYKLFVVLAAGLVVLINNYTNNNDIIIGAPIYKQDIETKLINTVLVLRNPIEEKTAFKQLLLQVNQTIFAATENYSYPLELLPEKLNLPVYNGDFAAALFDIIILLENIHDKKYIQHLNNNMTFSFLKTGDHIQGALTYNSLLYRQETVERIINNFETTLETLMLNLTAGISSLDMLTENEKKQILYEFNNTGTVYSRAETIPGFFARQVEKTPDNIALAAHQSNQLPGSQPGKKSLCRITYRKLAEMTDQLAYVLRGKGVGPDRVVGIMLDQSIEMIIVILGILKAGGAYLPIEPGCPESRMLYMLEDSQVNLVLTALAILEGKSFARIQKLNPGSGSQVFVTRPRPQIENFESIGIPDRSLVNYETYNRYLGQSIFKNYITIQATRGCPYECAYCHKIWPKKHVVRSAAHILAEVKLYYDMGIRRFTFIDDIFNLHIKNSREFFQMVIENQLDIQISFPNGVRGDILTREYIDLMIKAGTIHIAFALETASPRLQHLIKKNINLDKLKENINYLCQKYPHVITELFTMHGFPTETEEEAMMTLNFIESIKWLHFPYVFILRIFPNSDMEKLALENGISRKAITESANLYYHDIPTTLPFDKNFTRRYRARFTNEYFLSKERLLEVLPYQLKVLTEDEIVQKYNSYLSTDIYCLNDLLNLVNITPDQLDTRYLLDKDHMKVPNLNEKIRRVFPGQPADKDALRILLLDLSQFFSDVSAQLNRLIEPPLGLMYLLTHLKHHLGSQIKGKIAKPLIDFDNYAELKILLEEFKPDVIGIRSLSIYKSFFHKTISLIRQWGYNVPIIVGGPYPSSEYNTILQDENIDCVVIGEGEETFLEILRRIIENGKKLPGEALLKEVAGITFNPRVKENKQTSPREIMMLDTMQDTLAKKNPGSLKWKPDPDSLAYVIYTSGSTGNPKGVPITHANISPLLHWGCRHLRIGPADRTIQNLSYFFDWSVWEIFITLISGACLYSLSREILLDPRTLVDFIDKNRITVLHITPTHHYYVVNVGHPLPTLKYLFIGAEKLAIDLVKRSIELVNDDCRLFNMYGPTEAAIISAVLDIHRLTADNYEELSSVPIGTPVGNTLLLVLNPHMGMCPIGVTGELYIAGDGLTRGYLNNPGLTKEKFDHVLLDYHDSHDEKQKKQKFLWGGQGGGFLEKSPPGRRRQKTYKTGDLARWLPEGNIEFLGRKDHQVKVRGFRIELGEIEARLLTYRHIKEAVVLSGEAAKDDPYNTPGKTDQYLYAYITADHPLESHEIKDFLAGELPDYMIPSYIEQLGTMPLTPNGKIDRKALKPPQWKAGFDYVPPGDDVERKLAVIWSEVLQVEKEVIGINSDFFDLGGNSLSATILISKLHKAFDVKIPLMIFFTTSTIRELAIYVKQSPSSREHFTAIEPVEDKEYHRLSSDQKRLYILQQMDPTSTVYNVSEMVKLEGKLENDLLEKVFEELINRHESLRTSFEIVNMEPVQVIQAQAALAIEFYSQDWQPGTNRSWQQYDCIKGFIRPFVLSQAPLLRVGLIQMHPRPGPGHPPAAPANQQKENPHSWYILMVDMHHIITDGTSMVLLVKEFMALYAGRELPILRLQYKDYTAWQNQEKQQEAIKQQEKYWLMQFAGEIPLLALPLDFPRPAVKSTAGDRLDFIIGKDQVNKLRTLAVEKGVTLYMLFLSIFNIFLHKISGQEDIIVGSDTAGRGHADLQNVIGMFVNTLALRNYPTGTKTFVVFLEEVKKRTLEAFDNQDYQFERLVEKVAVGRAPGRNPIFDVTFYFYGINDMGQDLSTKMKIPFLDMEVLDSGLTSSKFDLTLHVIESENKLIFTFEYCTKLFKTQKIQAFAALFQEITAAVSEHPGIRLRDIKLPMYLMTEEKEEVKLDDLDF